jgi:NADH dehydrogenase FAD-containing subunit
MTRPRVVVAGLGDTGLLTAIHLARHAEVVGISAKPGLLSGQELGVRLTRPADWAARYWIPFERYRRLDGVRTVHGTLTDLDPAARTVRVELSGGVVAIEPYDVLIIASGVRNGFWRRPELEDSAAVRAGLRSAHERLATAGSIAVIGGGAAAVSAAGNAALTWPDKRIDLYFPGDAALLQHHPRVWRALRSTLEQRNVGVHPWHRACLPPSVDRITEGPVAWSTGQPAARADAVVWAIGKVVPNTNWLPAELLDDGGFVRVDRHLQLPGHPDMFAIGDVAATDPLRSSARNRADRLLARNVRAQVGGRRMRAYKPARHRWGSVLGVQPNGLEVFAPTGHPFRFPGWSVETLLWPLIVRRGIYGGVRAAAPTQRQRYADTDRL